MIYTTYLGDGLLLFYSHYCNPYMKTEWNRWKDNICLFIHFRGSGVSSLALATCFVDFFFLKTRAEISCMLGLWASMCLYSYGLTPLLCLGSLRHQAFWRVWFFFPPELVATWSPANINLSQLSGENVTFGRPFGAQICRLAFWPLLVMNEDMRIQLMPRNLSKPSNAPPILCFHMFWSSVWSA
jgi:hypothetical protein